MNQERRENQILGHLSGSRDASENNEYRPLRQRSVEKQNPQILNVGAYLQQ